MKKLLVVFVLLAVIATGTAFADHPSGWGVGILGRGAGGWGAGGVGGGGALSLKVPSLPIFWGIDFDINSWGFGVGVTGDYYLIDQPLVSDINLHWFLGVGGYAGLTIGDDYLGLGLGARVPIGLSWQPIDLLEIFVDVVPSIGLSILPDIGLGGGWRGELGLRLWF